MKDVEDVGASDVSIANLRSILSSPAWAGLDDYESAIYKFFQNGYIEDKEVLMCKALLSCVASKKEKAIALYNVFQDNSWEDNEHTHIAACDKDIKKNLMIMFRLATVNLIEHGCNALGKDWSICRNFDNLREVFEELIEDWLDEIFGRKAKLENKEFIEKVMSTNANWILYPEQIRKMVFDRAGIDQSIYH